MPRIATYTQCLADKIAIYLLISLLKAKIGDMFVDSVGKFIKPY
jgi:hypothetical protein